MMHSNPFSPTGYDISGLQSEIRQKADRHEIHSLRSEVDRLERTLREVSADAAGLRDRCERIECALRELNPGLNI